MMMRRLIWLIVLSFSFAFIVTAAAGPVVSVVACAGVLIYALAVTRGDAARRAEATEAEAAAAEATAAAEAVIRRSRGSDSSGPTTPARRGRFLILYGPAWAGMKSVSQDIPAVERDQLFGCGLGRSGSGGRTMAWGAHRAALWPEPQHCRGSRVGSSADRFGCWGLRHRLPASSGIRFARDGCRHRTCPWAPVAG